MLLMWFKLIAARSIETQRRSNFSIITLDLAMDNKR